MRSLIVSAGTLLLACTLVAQQEPEKPLPDVNQLMREVEAHQRAAEALGKNYIYREDSTFNETNKDGSVKKTEENAYDMYTSEGVRVARKVRKDNRDLTPDELKKEDDRIAKEIAKAKEKRAKADAEGKETDSRGRDEITVSRILELGTFSNPRREMIAGRPTILVDYLGDPNAKTHNIGEATMKELAGTVWVDEADRVIVRGEGHFVHDVRIGGGLLADIKAGTSFSGTFARIHDEVWLPADFSAQGHARYLLFFTLNGNAHIHTSRYRKFKTTSTISPHLQQSAGRARDTDISAAVSALR